MSGIHLDPVFRGSCVRMTGIHLDPVFSGSHVYYLTNQRLGIIQ